MSDEVEGDFPCAKPFKRNGKKAKKQNSLAFKLSVDTEAKCKELKSLALTPIQETFINSRFEDLDDLEYDDNVESFYSETHEDEGDPNHAKLKNKNEAKRRESDLQMLTLQDQADRALLSTKLEAKWKSHLTSFKKRVEELEKKMFSRQNQQHQELIEHIQEHATELKKRGSDELKNLINKSQSEIERINGKYKQYCDQRGNLAPQIMQMRNMELQDQSQKFNEEKLNLEKKVKALLAESESDRKKKFLKLEKHHLKRRGEVELALERLAKKCKISHDQLTAKIIKRHEETYQRLGDDIIHQGAKFHTKLSETETTKASKDCGKIDAKSGAALRLKRRKMYLSRSFIPTFMTVEIHNEGLIVACRNENTNGDGVSDIGVELKISNDFIPWGYTARAFLFSIACGEIPDNNIINHRLVSQGLQGQGQLKALVADMRVSANTAASQWENKEENESTDNLPALAEKMKAKLASDIKAERSCNDEMKKSSAHVEKTNKSFADLRNKAQPFFNEGGSKRNETSNEDYMRLSHILTKSGENVKNAEQGHSQNGQKMALARAQRIETTVAYKHILQQISDAKQSPPNGQNSKVNNGDGALSDFLSAFYKVASDRRSSQNNVSKSKSQKDASLRCVVIVLRSPQNSSKEARVALKGSKETVTDESIIRVEQLLLLSLHPYSDKKLSGTPPETTGEEEEWAEPGWHLDLDVPETRQNKVSILQTPNTPNCAFNYLHYENSSSQGHQMASMIGSRHLQALCIGCETLDTEKTTSGSNPLSLTEEEIDKCYSFHVEARPPAPKKRRRSRADGNPKGKKKIAQENS